MSKEWDNTGVAFSDEFWEQCIRVLRPNGIVKAFSGTRTFHRMVKAMRDVGFADFEIHAWVYGSGFPKSLNISKALDKTESVGREISQQWQGYGTALKPAWEPIVVARKPF
jgi:site-specific DNA-methyltransferase (adenine-specific)